MSSILRSSDKGIEKCKVCLHSSWCLPGRVILFQYEGQQLKVMISLTAVWIARLSFSSNSFVCGVSLTVSLFQWFCLNSEMIPIASAVLWGAFGPHTNAGEEMKEDNMAFNILLLAVCVCKGWIYQCKSALETGKKLCLWDVLLMMMF